MRGAFGAPGPRVPGHGVAAGMASKLTLAGVDASEVSTLTDDREVVGAVGV